MFVAMNRLKAFKDAISDARVPGTKPLHAGHPQFEGFEAVQSLREARRPEPPRSRRAKGAGWSVSNGRAAGELGRRRGLPRQIRAP